MPDRPGLRCVPSSPCSKGLPSYVTSLGVPILHNYVGQSRCHIATRTLWVCHSFSQSGRNDCGMASIDTPGTRLYFRGNIIYEDSTEGA